MKTIKQLLATKLENEEFFKIGDISEDVLKDTSYIRVKVDNVINSRMDGVCEENYRPSQTNIIIDPEYQLKRLIEEGYVDVYDEVEALYYEVEAISKTGRLPIKYVQELYINDTKEVMTVNGTVENETMTINTNKE